MRVVEFLRHPKSEICHFSSVVWNSQMTPLRSQGALGKEGSDMGGTPEWQLSLCKGRSHFWGASTLSVVRDGLLKWN